MSQNNIPATLPSVERLLNRIAVAERSQQKDVRISVQEGRELANDLALLTIKMSKTVQEVHQMLKEIKESTTNIDVKFDGGGF
jgi:methyl-accepting chemotaxis protein